MIPARKDQEGKASKVLLALLLRCCVEVLGIQFGCLINEGDTGEPGRDGNLLFHVLHCVKFAMMCLSI